MWYHFSAFHSFRRQNDTKTLQSLDKTADALLRSLPGAARRTAVECGSQPGRQKNSHRVLLGIRGIRSIKGWTSHLPILIALSISRRREFGSGTITSPLERSSPNSQTLFALRRGLSFFRTGNGEYGVQAISPPNFQWNGIDHIEAAFSCSGWPTRGPASASPSRMLRGS